VDSWRLSRKKVDFLGKKAADFRQAQGTALVGPLIRFSIAEDGATGVLVVIGTGSRGLQVGAALEILALAIAGDKRFLSEPRQGAAWRRLPTLSNRLSGDRDRPLKLGGTGFASPEFGAEGLRDEWPDKRIL
jgi:hypothetical protein